VAERQKLEEVLGSIAVEAKPVEEVNPVEGPKSLEDARADGEVQPLQGTTNGDETGEEPSTNGTDQDHAKVTTEEVHSSGNCGCF